MLSVLLEKWISDSNYEKSLLLNRELLDLICASSVGEEQAGKLKSVFTAVRYTYSPEQFKKGQL